MQAPAANVAIIVLTILFFIVLSDRVDIFILSFWAFSVLALAGLRTIIWFYHKIKPGRFTTLQWINIYTLVTALLGLGFGGAYLVGYQNQDPIVFFTLSFVFFSLISAAGYVLSCHMPIFIAYTFPQTFIFAAVLLANPTFAEKIIAFGIIVYLAMLTVFTRNANQQFIRTIRLKTENSSLIDDLNQEVEQREFLIETRTTELVETNEILEKEIHERKNAQSEAGFQVSLLNSVFNSTPDLIYYKDYVNLDGCYIGCNDAFAKLIGVPELDIIGQNDVELFGDEEGRYLRAKDQVALHANDTFMYEEWATYPDGKKILLSALKTPLYDHNQNLLGILGVGRDITEMKLAEQQLQRKEISLHHLAHHDTLTELPNRLLLADRLKQSIKKAERANVGLAVMFIDLDHFKEINDSLGHSIGDQLLQAVAVRLKETIRKEDTAARLGGDEFTIILEQLEDTKYASILAEKLLIAFKQPLKLREREITITLSIGISLFPEHGRDTETLLRNADSAMYRTKNEGRNGFSLYTEDLTQRAVERVLLESALRKAIENDGLELYFQPQIDMNNGEVVGSEALVRWVHPEEGLILPGRFIPLAEEIGLIDEIGMWVFRTSCEKIVEWQNSDFFDIKVAINISGRQLLDEKFAHKIRAIIEDTGCRPELLELEITEDYLIKHPEKTVSQFNELRDIGMHIAIDDFGTGYSSLTYLKQFPISKLKIDYSFIQDILVDTNDQAITRAIIALGKSLGLTVIAEGVEKKQQHDFVLAEGCDEAQGYYYARPMPELQFLEYIQKKGTKKLMKIV